MLHWLPGWQPLLLCVRSALFGCRRPRLAQITRWSHNNHELDGGCLKPQIPLPQLVAESRGHPGHITLQAVCVHPFLSYLRTLPFNLGATQILPEILN